MQQEKIQNLQNEQTHLSRLLNGFLWFKPSAKSVVCPMNTNRCCIFIIAILHQNDFIRGMPNAAAEIISTAFCNFWHLLRIEVIFFLKLEVEKNCSVCIIISRDDRNTTSHWRTNPLRELGPELKSQMGFISIGNT